MDVKGVIIFTFLLAAVFFQAASVQGKVCVDFDQMTSLASAVSSGSSTPSRPAAKTPQLRTPTPRPMAYSPQYLGDGIYAPDPAHEERQKGYEASRIAMDDQPLPQPPQTVAPPVEGQKHSGSSSASSSGGWTSVSGTILSKVKCRGICF